MGCDLFYSGPKKILQDIAFTDHLHLPEGFNKALTISKSHSEQSSSKMLTSHLAGWSHLHFSQLSISPPGSLMQQQALVYSDQKGRAANKAEIMPVILQVSVAPW